MFSLCAWVGVWRARTSVRHVWAVLALRLLEPPMEVTDSAVYYCVPAQVRGQLRSGAVGSASSFPTELASLNSPVTVPHLPFLNLGISYSSKESGSFSNRYLEANA